MATVFTAVGESVVADLVDGTSSNHLNATNSHIGWGTGGTTAAKGDTALGTAASEARVVCAVSQPAADTLRFVSTITADGTKTIIEAGLFDAITSGNMPVRGDFGGIGVELNDQVQFTIDLEFQ